MKISPLFWAVLVLLIAGPVLGQDLDEIRKQGVLRHLGVPYSNFVTGSGDGVDVELVRNFARYLGVRYEYVGSSWETIIPDLIGRNIKAEGTEVQLLSAVTPRGDILANGLTILPWREKILDYSDHTYPTQAMLIATAHSSLKPIRPSGDPSKDIDQVKKQMHKRSCLGVKNTCLDPALYALQEHGARVIHFTGALEDLPAAIIKGEAETAIMEMPDAQLAMKKYPGRIKIIGPLSKIQYMAAGFSKKTPNLRTEFNKFLMQCKKDGTYLKIVRKYYPSAPEFYQDFFK